MDEEERFQLAIPRSNAAVVSVLDWLFRNNEWWVKAKPAVARPTGCAPKDENTDADIYVSKNGIDCWRAIEVKHRRLIWTSAADYPYRTILLDRIKPKLPDWYFIVNREMSGVAIVPVSKTKERWIESVINDRDKAGNPFVCRFCPVNLSSVRWEPLNCALR